MPIPIILALAIQWTPVPSDHLATALGAASELVRPAETAALCGKRSDAWVKLVSGRIASALFMEKDALAKAAGIPLSDAGNYILGAVIGQAAMVAHDIAQRGIGITCNNIAASPGWDAYLAPLDQMLARERL